MSDKKKPFSYYGYIQLKAIDSLFNSNDLYFHRKVCRWYSKEFSTPLNQVLTLPFDDVLTHYYESQFEQIPYNDLIDLMTETHLTDLSDKEEDEIEEWLKHLEEEQSRILKEKQSLNNQAVPTVNNQSFTSDPPLKPEDVVMSFNEDDFESE
jgi:hypothetical protein